MRAFVRHLVPEANELIWDNYNAVAIAYSKSEKLKDAFFHIAVYSKHINFGFNRGAELKKGSINLKGNGKLIRHITIKHYDAISHADIGDLIREAAELSESLNTSLKTQKTEPKSIVMSISEKKIRPQIKG